MFFDKKCTIRTVSYTKVGGTSKKKHTLLYKCIECNFENQRQQRVLVGTEYAENANAKKLTVVLPVKYNKVRENQKISLIDPVFGDIGDFLIESVQADQSISGAIDCITLSVIPMKGQL